MNNLSTADEKYTEHYMKCPTCQRSDLSLCLEGMLLIQGVLEILSRKEEAEAA